MIGWKGKSDIGIGPQEINPVWYSPRSIRGRVQINIMKDMIKAIAALLVMTMATSAVISLKDPQTGHFVIVPSGCNNFIDSMQPTQYQYYKSYSPDGNTFYCPAYLLDTFSSAIAYYYATGGDTLKDTVLNIDNTGNPI